MKKFSKVIGALMLAVALAGVTIPSAVEAHHITCKGIINNCGNGNG